MQPSLGSGPRGPASNVVQAQLTYEWVAKAKSNFCGSFASRVKWKITGVPKGPGIIVQHIKRTFSVEKYDALTKKWTALATAKDVDTYVAGSGGTTALDGWEEYWEAWVVPNNSTRPTGAPAYDDQFALTAVIAASQVTQNTTKGWYQITGTATFYSTPKVANPDPTVYGFTAGTNAEPTGPLPYAKADPAATLATKKAVKDTSVTHTVKVKWDSTEQGDGGWGTNTYEYS